VQGQTPTRAPTQEPFSQPTVQPTSIYRSRGYIALWVFLSFFVEGVFIFGIYYFYNYGRASSVVKKDGDAVASPSSPSPSAGYDSANSNADGEVAIDQVRVDLESPQARDPTIVD